MSIEQVRTVLDKRYPHGMVAPYGISASVADEIHALYASERGGDDVQALASALNKWYRAKFDKTSDEALAAAILRAINARVGAKTAREGGVHAPIVEALDTVCEGWDDKRYASDKPHTDADMAAAAIRALAEAKATAERELQLAKNKLCAIGNTLASKPSDYEGRAVDGVTLKGASGNVLFNSDAQVAP